MKKLLLCLFFAAAIAPLFHTFQWERTARRDWKAYNVAVVQAESEAAELKALGL